MIQLRLQRGQKEWFLPADAFVWDRGLFTAILVGLIAVRVQKYFTDRNLVVDCPCNVRRVVYESFLSLTPFLCLIVSFWLIRYVLGVDINAGIQKALSPLVFALKYAPRDPAVRLSGHCCGFGESTGQHTPWTPS